MLLNYSYIYNLKIIKSNSNSVSIIIHFFLPPPRSRSGTFLTE